MSRYLITGVNGYVGGNFADFILKEKPGSAVVGVGLGDCKNKKIDYRNLDLCDFRETSNIVLETNPDFIFHFAGCPGSNDWKKLIDANVRTTVSLLEACKKIPNGRIFIVGSAAEYGKAAQTELPVKETMFPRPATIYGISMVCRSDIAKGYAEMGLDVVVGRLFNPLGAGLGTKHAAGSFAKQVNDLKSGKQKPPLLVGNLGTKRDFVDIRDACSAFLAIAEKGQKGSIYNVCSGKSYSMKELLDLMLREKGIEAEIKQEESRIRANDITDIYGSIEKIENDTGWRPKFSIEQSVRDMLTEVLS